MSANLPVNDVRVFKGASKDIPFSVSDSLGGKDLSNYNVTLMVRQNAASEVLISKSSTVASEIEFTDVMSGQMVIHFIPSDTESIASGRFVYSIWIENKTNANEKRPVSAGHFWSMLAVPSVVDTIRGILDEGGELAIRQVKDEIASPATTTRVYVRRTRMKAVLGVWLLMDQTHALTNYYTGGGFNEKTGEVWLATALPDVISDVRISYTWESGIDTDTIMEHLINSQNWVKQYSGISFEYAAASTDREEAAENLAKARTVLLCVMTINGANAAMLGYNFRLGEFEIQSKLWGEGMISESLFGLYREYYHDWKQVVGMQVHFKFARKRATTSLNTYLNKSAGGYNPDTVYVGIVSRDTGVVEVREYLDVSVCASITSNNTFKDLSVKVGIS